MDLGYRLHGVPEARQVVRLDGLTLGEETPGGSLPEVRMKEDAIEKNLSATVALCTFLKLMTN